VKPSPNWLQDRLKAIGITPKNNVVDVTNYVLHEGQPFTPLMPQNKWKNNCKTLPSGTKFTTLDDVERTFMKTL
jgi:phenylalanyl-tRNA synthetase beta chain